MEAEGGGWGGGGEAWYGGCEEGEVLLAVEPRMYASSASYFWRSARLSNTVLASDRSLKASAATLRR